MVLVVMFLCDQSYASHGRDFLLGATILNPSEISTLSLALVSAFLWNQSYASHGRDFLLGAKILNFNV